MRATLALVFAAATAAGAAQAQNVHINPANSFIASAVKVPAGAETVYVSGQLADPVAAGSNELGDTRTQTVSIMKKIEAILKAEGYALSDTVMMRVILVGDPAKGGAMDFTGMNEAYLQFYGPLQKPARITSQSVALARPGALVEIEVQAAKKK